MSVYVIVEVEILDHAAYETIKQLTPPIVAQYGGKYLARGGETEVLEGSWTPLRLVILEFENAERAKAWWHSPEFAPIKEMRNQSTHTNMVLIEGKAAN